MTLRVRKEKTVQALETLADLNLWQFTENMKNVGLQGNWNLLRDNSVDATFCIDFAATRFDASYQVGCRQSIEGHKEICQMTNSDQTHPLGDEETDQINSAVAEELTPAQLEWLRMQSTVVGRKKLQILRQALFEWVSEHLEYRFTEARFGDTVRRALEEFMSRHGQDILVSKTDKHAGDAQPQ